MEKKFQQIEAKSKKVKKRLEDMDDGTNKKKTWKKIILVVSVILILGLFCSTIFALVNMNNSKMMSGISIMGIEVSGLAKDEAKAKIESIYKDKKEQEIDIKYNEFESTINPVLLEIQYNIDKAIEQAYSIGRTNNIFQSNFEILLALIQKKNINIDMTINETVARQNIQDVGINLPGILIDTSHTIEGDKLTITRGKEGIKIDVEKMMTKLKEILNDITITKHFIEIPVINAKPEEINIDKIHAEVYKEAKDAYYIKEPFTIYPEVEGIDFDIEEAKKIVNVEKKDEYIITLKITKPTKTINQIGTEAFPDQLATYTTRYDASLKDRSTNLSIACNKINGKVILPGETFSYNKVLGPRTVAAGYKNAAVYENGAVVDGIGGGICQISSTLYNAVLMANLEIVERKNHQFVTSYTPAGRDATVAYGIIDFKFKNTRSYPIRISASVKSGVATVSIYGIKGEEYTFSFTYKVIATIPYSIKYEEDANKAVGTETIKQKGANGQKVQTYITKMLNGKTISTTLLSTDTYDAMNRIVIRGTKGNPEVTLPPVEKPAEPTTPDPDPDPAPPAGNTNNTTNTTNTINTVN